MTPTKTLVIRHVPAELHRRIRIAAATAGQGVSEWAQAVLARATAPK